MRKGFPYGKPELTNGDPGFINPSLWGGVPGSVRNHHFWRRTSRLLIGGVHESEVNINPVMNRGEPVFKAFNFRHLPIDHS